MDKDKEYIIQISEFVLKQAFYGEVIDKPLSEMVCNNLLKVEKFIINEMSGSDKNIINMVDLHEIRNNDFLFYINITNITKEFDEDLVNFWNAKSL